MLLVSPTGKFAQIGWAFSNYKSSNNCAAEHLPKIRIISANPMRNRCTLICITNV